MNMFKSKMSKLFAAGLLLIAVSIGCTPQESSTNGNLEWLIEFAAAWGRAWLAALLF